MPGIKRLLINVPISLESALKAYVAYLVYSGMNTQEAVANSQKYLAQYNEILRDTIEQDIVSSSYSQTNIKFDERGWV